MRLIYVSSQTLLLQFDDSATLADPRPSCHPRHNESKKFEQGARSYGWGEDWRAGLLTEDEILARLFRLNQERASS